MKPHRHYLLLREKRVNGNTFGIKWVSFCFIFFLMISMTSSTQLNSTFIYWNKSNSKSWIFDNWESSRLVNFESQFSSLSFDFIPEIYTPPIPKTNCAFKKNWAKVAFTI